MRLHLVAMLALVLGLSVTVAQSASAETWSTLADGTYVDGVLSLRFDQPASIWTYPVETVSQSEGGFELVHQSVAVLPHWIVVPDAEGRWSVTVRLAIDTQLAESRMPQIALAAGV